MFLCRQTEERLNDCNSEGRNGSENTGNVTSHPLEHPRLFLPETNSFPEKENVRLVKGRKWTIFLGYMKPKTLPGPKVADKMKSATMSNVNKDILFLEKEIFPIYRRKDRQKVLMFYGKFTN